MANYGLDVECPHIFDGTHFTRWKNWMICNFKFICSQMWWIVDVGFSHAIDENNATQAQEKCLHLNYQATNIIYRSLDDCILGEIIDMKTAHEIWIYLNEKYGVVTNDIDDEPKKVAHEDVEHDHNLVIVEDCSSTWSSDDDIDEESTTSSLDKINGSRSIDANDCYISSTLDDDKCSCSDNSATTSSPTPLHCLMSHGDAKVSIGNVVVDCDDPNLELVYRLTKSLEKEMAKTKKLKNENSFLKSTCEQQKHLLYVTTCSHEELKLVHEELSVAHENLVQDHAFLTKELSNEKIKTSESSSLGSNDQSHNVANPCDVGKKHVSTSCDDLLDMPCSSHIDACSSSMSCETNLLKEKNELNEQVKILSNKLERCYNSMVSFEHMLNNKRSYGDMSGIGFNKSKENNMKMQEEKISHFMCYRCHDMGHLAKYCPTKKPQVEPKEKLQVNHQNGDLGMTKKKTRRGGKAKAKHQTPNQDGHMMRKNQDEKKDYAHIKCFKCKNMGHFASRCPTKLDKKTQATHERHGNEKQYMSKEEKTQSKRVCYSCRERGHMANSCPLGNDSKHISIDSNNNVLRKDDNGTSKVAIAKHPATHTKAMPKYVAPNLRGPKLVWVPSKSG